MGSVLANTPRMIIFVLSKLNKENHAQKYKFFWTADF